jgi:hypothetical protein
MPQDLQISIAIAMILQRLQAQIFSKDICMMQTLGNFPDLLG